MKIKKTFIAIGLVLITAFSLSLGVYNHVNGLSKKDMIIKHKNSADKMLNAAWQDIKKSYNINENKYIKLDFNDLCKYDKEKYGAYIDELFYKEILSVVSKNMETLTIGSTKPFILINKDKSQILFLYKDKDGLNIKIDNTKKDNGWENKKDNLKGEPKLDISKEL